MQQRPLPDPRPESQSLLRRKVSPAGPVHLVWPPVLLWRPACTRQGVGRGQSPEGGVDWCLDKVREEAELKAEDLLAWGQD